MYIAAVCYVITLCCHLCRIGSINLPGTTRDKGTCVVNWRAILFHKRYISNKPIIYKYSSYSLEPAFLRCCILDECFKSKKCLKDLGSLHFNCIHHFIFTFNNLKSIDCYSNRHKFYYSCLCFSNIYLDLNVYTFCILI